MLTSVSSHTYGEIERNSGEYQKESQEVHRVDVHKLEESSQWPDLQMLQGIGFLKVCRIRVAHMDSEIRATCTCLCARDKIKMPPLMFMEWSS